MILAPLATLLEIADNTRSQLTIISILRSEVLNSGQKLPFVDEKR
jgi:hypothetical protein